MLPFFAFRIVSVILALNPAKETGLKHSPSNMYLNSFKF